VTKIKVPQMNANDESAVLLEWVAAEGTWVKEGQLLAILETSKVTYELVSESEGYLHTTGRPGEEYDCGCIIGSVTEKADLVQKVDRTSISILSNHHEITFTKAARRLFEKSGLDRAEFDKLGKSLIREEDVKQVLAQDKVEVLGNLREISAVQKRVAETVIKSHNQIPAAYASVNMYCTRAESILGKINKEGGRNLGLSELLIWSLARAREEFPFFFARYKGKGQVEVAGESNIAVTVDFGDGLFLPVLRNADNKDLQGIEDELSRLRLAIMRKGATGESFEGATIGLSLNLTPSINTVIPIIPPSLTAIVATGGVQKTVVFKDGSCQPESMLTVGVSYDHRVINGESANRFLMGLKNRIEELAQC
jgi:2-oxoglutarate dehydrogenase E2 component (dihydrolipoamide succinyltransferase)